jgi:hypothetical protein
MVKTNGERELNIYFPFQAMGFESGNKHFGMRLRELGLRGDECFSHGA